MPAAAHLPRPRRWRYGRAAAAAALVAGAVAVTAAPVLAQTLDVGLSNDFADRAGLLQGDPRVIIANVIRGLLGFLGLIAVAIVLYGGYLWMTAAGNEERVRLARRVLTNGLIGLLIILSAFSIVSFFLRRLQDAANRAGGGPGGGGDPTRIALGGGIIEDHYPGRNATGVPRSVSVIITFREPIFVAPDGDPQEPKSFALDAAAVGAGWSGRVNPQVFQLVLANPVDPSNNPPLVAAAVRTLDNQTFVIDPDADIGSLDNPVKYRAIVTTALTKADGTAPLKAVYQWTFTVSTFTDNTPPQVVDVTPAESVTPVPRNDTVQVTFDEPIDPTSATGEWNPANPDFDFPNLTVHDGAANVSGRFVIGNGYRTVEFVPNFQCGVNACGEEIFCLPENKTLLVTARAATLRGGSCALALDPASPDRACPNPAPNLFFDGVVDASGNSLDGERDPLTVPPAGPMRLPSGDQPPDAEGPQAPPAYGDTFRWNFATSDAVVKTAPTILRTTPDNAVSAVSQTDPFTATFSRRLKLFRNRDFQIYDTAGRVLPQWAGMSVALFCTTAPTQACNDADASTTNDTDDCPAAAGEPKACGLGVAELHHDTLQENERHQPRIASSVKDRYGNCFTPSRGPLDATPPVPPGQGNVLGPIDQPPVAP